MLKENKEPLAFSSWHLWYKSTFRWIEQHILLFLSMVAIRFFMLNIEQIPLVKQATQIFTEHPEDTQFGFSILPSLLVIIFGNIATLWATLAFSMVIRHSLGSSIATLNQFLILSLRKLPSFIALSFIILSMSQVLIELFSLHYVTLLATIIDKSIIGLFKLIAGSMILIFLLARYSLALPIFVYEQYSGLAALRRSWKITKTHYRSITPMVLMIMPYYSRITVVIAAQEVLLLVLLFQLYSEIVKLHQEPLAHPKQPPLKT